MLTRIPFLCNTGNTMARSTAVLSISVPQNMMSEITKWSKLERKSKTELIQEAIKWYRRWKFNKNWAYIRKRGEETRKKFNLKTEDDLYEFIHGD